MRLKEVVDIKPILRVIDFQSRDKSLIDGYVVMDQTVKHFTRILEGFTQIRDEASTMELGSIQLGTVARCHKITGTYGVGKSYFILMLKAILESLEDEQSFNDIKYKFKDFENIIYQLDNLRKEGKKYIIVSINGKSFAELDFKSVIENQVYKAIIEKIDRNKLQFDSFFEKTVDQLKLWQESNSPIYKEFEMNFREKVDYTYDEMIQGLENREVKAKEKYTEVYREIMREEPSNTFDSLDKFLNEANENVINNGYDGIVILYDEFSTYLRGRLEKGYLNTDLASIDILAEATMLQSAKQIHFITTEHEDVKEIFKVALDNMDTVNKTAGRFKDYSLYFEKGAELVQGVIVRDEEKFKPIKFENSNIFDAYSKVNDYANLEEIYPINPFALEYLVRISEKYAQGDRTLFTFIDENLRSFIETNKVLLNNHLNLLAVDAIMETFEADILRGREEFAKAYNIQMERANSKLQKRVVKVLALDYAVTITDAGKIRSGVNNENIGYILSLSEEEAKDVRDYLQKEQNDASSYIIFNEGANGYELSPDTQGINLEEEINKELKNTNEIRMLENLILSRSAALDIKKQFLIPKESKIFPFDRLIEGKFIKSLGQLEELDIEEELESCNRDGKIIFYIPQAGQTYDYRTILNTAQNKIGEAKSERIVIAIPKTFKFYGKESNMLRRYEALQRLTKYEDIMDNIKAVNSIRLEIVKLRTQIYNNLSYFGRSENFVFLFKDEALEYVNNIREMLINWLVNKIYTKFPTVNAEDFSSRSPSNQLIQHLIVPKKAEKVNLNSSRVHAKQIRDTLEPLDLVKLVQTPHGHRVEIKRPTDHEVMGEIFKILEKPEEELTIKDKYNLLTAPPYGLNEPLFETFFAIFIRVSGEHYLRSKDGLRIEVTHESINSVWNKEYSLCVTQDAVAYNIKRDAINILKVLDRADLFAQSYKQLNPQDPSDEFGKPEKSGIFLHYINDFQQKVEKFIDNLKTLGINTPVLENIDDIKKYLERTKKIFNPADMLNSVSNLIDIHFNNDIPPDETGDINILRYEKLQNLLDNIKWLRYNKDKLEELGDIIDNLTNITKDLDFVAISDAVEEAQSQFNNILFNKIALDNWKDSKYEQSIDLSIIDSGVSNVIEQYNNKYKESHEILNIKKNDLIADVRSNKNIPLIESLEQINFENVKRLSNLQKQIDSVKICNYNFDNSDGKIFLCNNCGKLEQIIRLVKHTEQEENNINKEIYEILKNYIEGIEDLVDLDKVKTEYGKACIITDYINENYPEQSGKITKLIGYIRDSWEDNIENIIELVNELYPILNEYIEPSEVVGEKEEEISEVSYKEIIDKIGGLIRISGYKKMSFKQFEREVIKQLKKLGENFDEVIISD